MKTLDFKIYQEIANKKKISEIFLGTVEIPWKFARGLFSADCTEAISLNLFEKAICGVLSIDEELSISQLSKILGINYDSKPESLIFRDEAESEILTENLTGLYEYGMISRDDESYSKFRLTDIGREYFAQKKKFKKGQRKKFTLYFDLESKDHSRAKEIFSSIAPTFECETGLGHEEFLTEQYIKSFAVHQIPQIYDERIGNSFTNLECESFYEMIINVNFAVLFDIITEKISFIPAINSIDNKYIEDVISHNEELCSSIQEHFLNNQPNFSNLENLPNSYIESIVSLQQEFDYAIFNNQPEIALNKVDDFVKHATLIEFGKLFEYLQKRCAGNTNTNTNTELHINEPLLDDITIKEINNLVSNKNAKVFLTTTTCKGIDSSIFVSDSDTSDTYYSIAGYTLLPRNFSFNIEGKAIILDFVEIIPCQENLIFDHKKHIAEKYLKIAIEHYRTTLDKDFSTDLNKSLKILEGSRNVLDEFEEFASELGLEDEIQGLDNKRDELLLNVRSLILKDISDSLVHVSDVDITKVDTLEQINELLQSINSLQEEQDCLEYTLDEVEPDSDYLKLYKKLREQIVDFRDTLLIRERSLRQNLLPKLFVIDTNVFVLCPKIMDYIPNTDNIIVSLMVLNELDSLKNRMTGKEKKNVKDAIKAINYKLRMKSQNFRTEAGDLKLLPDEYQRKTGDFMILSLAYRYLERNVFLLTNDFNLQNFALSLGVPIKTLEDIAPDDAISKFDNKPSLRTTTEAKKESNIPKDLYDIFIQVFNKCNNIKSEVSMADFGSTLKKDFPDFSPKNYGYEKLKLLCEAYPDAVELYNNAKNAICIKIRKVVPSSKSVTTTERDKEVKPSSTTNARSLLNNLDIDISLSNERVLLAIIKAMVEIEDHSAPFKDEDFQQMFFVKKGFQPKIQDIEKARSILNIPTKNQRLINYNKAN